MMYSRTGFTTACLLALVLVSACGTNSSQDFTESGSVAAFEQLPFVSNEKLGMFNYIHSISITPPDALNAEDWGPALPFGEPDNGAPGGGVNMHRYSLAFTEYGVSMLAELTPAYRARHIEALDGMIQKMLDPIVWDYWMRGDELGFDWGGDNPIHPYNIMYTGHLQLMMAFYERQAGDRKYIDNDVALTTEDGSQTWTTNLDALSRRTSISRAWPTRTATATTSTRSAVRRRGFSRVATPSLSSHSRSFPNRSS